MSVFDPTERLGASVPLIDASERIALDLMNKPTIAIPFPFTNGPRLVVGGTGILAGVNLRDAATGTSPLVYLSASSANAAAANNVTLGAAAFYTTYVTGFEITGDGATAGSIITVTLTGILGGTATYYITVPTGAGTAITPLTVEFTSPGFPASATNQTITLNVPSFGGGNTNAAVTIRGYRSQGGAQGSPGGPPITVSLDVLDGLDAGGQELLPVILPPGGQLVQMMGRDGPLFREGIFITNALSSFVLGAVYVKI